MQPHSEAKSSQTEGRKGDAVSDRLRAKTLSPAPHLTGVRHTCAWNLLLSFVS